jgi:hypothetical protein
VQHTPAVAEAGRPHALGRHHEHRALQAGFPLGALLGEGGGLGDLLRVHGSAGCGRDGHDLHAVGRACDGAATERGRIDGQNGLGGLLGGVGHRVGASGGRADGHRGNHQPALHGHLRLPVCTPPAADRDDVGVRHAVAVVGVAVAVRVRRASFLPRIRPELRRNRKAQRCQVVGVVKVVEFGRMNDLSLAIEGTVVAEVEVSKLSELVERNDVGDLGDSFGDASVDLPFRRGPL